MGALHTELPIAAQIGVLLAILVGTLVGERLSKRTRWGFALWIGCIVALLICYFTGFFRLFLHGFAVAFMVFCSSALLADAYDRHSRMKGVK